MPVPTLAQLASRFEDVAAAGRRAALVPAGTTYSIISGPMGLTLTLTPTPTPTLTPTPNPNPNQVRGCGATLSPRW